MKWKNEFEVPLKESRQYTNKMENDVMLTEKACVICTQNSTPMPTDMTRLTTETAFSWIFRIAITPCGVSSCKQRDYTWAEQVNYCK
jgi:hypothetical protein